MALSIVDKFPRHKLIAGGTAVVLATLVAEAAVVASYPPGPDQNKAALKGGLSMIFLYIVGSIHVIYLFRYGGLLLWPLI